MTFEDLRVFVAVCEAGSLSAVARELGCTQPAVSQHVARLERELATPLIERGATGVNPTGAGDALYDAALDGLGAISTGIRRVEELRDGAVGALSVTTGGTTVRHFMRETVVRFRERHPGVVLQFVPGDSTRRCLEVVRRGSADLALITIGAPVRGIEQRTVVQQDLRLLVAIDDPLARRQRVRIQELEGIRYISMAERTTTYQLIQRAFANEGVALDATMSVDDFDTACAFVELGLGHAIAPAMQASHFVRDGRVHSVRIAGLEPVPIGWAARRWSALSTAALAFIEIFRSEMSKQKSVPGLTVASSNRAAVRTAARR